MLKVGWREAVAVARLVIADLQFCNVELKDHS